MFFLSVLLLAPPLSGHSETNALPRLSPPYGPLPPTFWEQHGPAVIAAGAALMVAAGWLWWRLGQPKPPRAVSPESQAREALAKWTGRPEDGNSLSSISQILRRYVACAFEFPAAELTTTEFCAELERHQRIGPELAEALSSFLRECDQRKFSPGGASAPLHAASRALELVGRLEKMKAGGDTCPAEK